MSNPLEDYFNAHTTGPGIWKWRHYFEIYDRHLSKFRGTAVDVAEVGIYSGGSLGMWRDYFGQGCTVHGIDIQPACARYENDWTKVYIGDQGEPRFWDWFKTLVPKLDVLIDDGGHTPGQQSVTLDKILPHLSPGGVYICEDILGKDNPFGDKIGKLSSDLHANVDIHATDMLAMGLTPFQRMVKSINVYAHVAVIEKWDTPPARFEAPAAGTEWICNAPEWK
jgi:hypothetical protein